MRTRPLTELSARDLRALLEEECEYWQDELLWDYTEVSAAVSMGLERRALTGRALLDGPRAIAYCYSMRDAGRAVVGSLFATAGLRGQGLEEELLESVLADALCNPANERVECQTLFSTARSADARFASAGFASRPREYMVRPLAPVVPGAPGDVTLRPVRREDLPLCGDIIHRSHEGSLDAALNLTYATPALCRGFVETLVLRAGCGRFDPDASFIAEAREGPVGVLLASRLSRANGHVCQVSVAPESQARGVGAALLSATLAAFRQAGLLSASLSVTVGNDRAHRLYERFGFRAHRTFAAHAWVRPPRRVALAGLSA